MIGILIFRPLKGRVLLLTGLQKGLGFRALGFRGESLEKSRKHHEKERTLGMQHLQTTKAPFYPQPFCRSVLVCGYLNTNPKKVPRITSFG